MLKRSKLLVAFLVVTVICASVGFAAVSDQLTATGNFAFNADSGNTELVEQVNTNVYFDNATTATFAEVTSGSGTGATVQVGNVDDDNVNDKITITIPATALLKQGDTVKVTATIKNENKAPVSLSIAGVDEWNTSGTYKTNISVATTGSDTQIAGKGSATVYFIFTLEQVPATSITAEQGTFTFTVTATTIDQLS